MNCTLKSTVNGAASTADIPSSTINGVLSLMNKLVKSSGKPIHTTRATFTQLLSADFSNDYMRNAAHVSFWFLNTGNTNVKGDVAINLGIKAGNCWQMKGRLLIQLSPSTDTSSLRSCRKSSYPTMALEIAFDLQSDTDLIWQNGSTARRVFVTTSELWVPMLKFTSIWSTCCGRAVDVHRREILTPSASRRHSNGSWQITPWIKKRKTCLGV